jgi:hypothetical protein
MKFSQIVRSLDTIELEGPQAERAARLGFLEWAMTVETDANRAARAALGRSIVASSPAAVAFLGFVRLVADAEQIKPIRRGGAASRRRMLH